MTISATLIGCVNVHFMGKALSSMCKPSTTAPDRRRALGETAARPQGGLAPAGGLPLGRRRPYAANCAGHYRRGVPTHALSLCSRQPRNSAFHHVNPKHDFIFPLHSSLDDLGVHQP